MSIPFCPSWRSLVDAVKAMSDADFAELFDAYAEKGHPFSLLRIFTMDSEFSGDFKKGDFSCKNNEIWWHIDACMLAIKDHNPLTFKYLGPKVLRPFTYIPGTPQKTNQSKLLYMMLVFCLESHKRGYTTVAEVGSGVDFGGDNHESLCNILTNENKPMNFVLIDPLGATAQKSIGNCVLTYSKRSVGVNEVFTCPVTFDVYDNGNGLLIQDMCKAPLKMKKIVEGSCPNPVFQPTSMEKRNFPVDLFGSCLKEVKSEIFCGCADCMKWVGLCKHYDIDITGVYTELLKLGNSCVKNVTVEKKIHKDSYVVEMLAPQKNPVHNKVVMPSAYEQKLNKFMGGGIYSVFSEKEVKVVKDAETTLYRLSYPPVFKGIVVIECSKGDRKVYDAIALEQKYLPVDFIVDGELSVTRYEKAEKMSVNICGPGSDIKPFSKCTSEKREGHFCVGTSCNVDGFGIGVVKKQGVGTAYFLMTQDGPIVKEKNVKVKKGRATNPYCLIVDYIMSQCRLDGYDYWIAMCAAEGSVKILGDKMLLVNGTELTFLDDCVLMDRKKISMKEFIRKFSFITGKSLIEIKDIIGWNISEGEFLELFGKMKTTEMCGRRW